VVRTSETDGLAGYWALAAHREKQLAFAVEKVRWPLRCPRRFGVDELMNADDRVRTPTGAMEPCP
jgi:hypothetical protein